MFSVASWLALLAFSVTGSPVEVRNSPITLPMTRRLTSSNVTDLLRHDEALVTALTECSTHGRRATAVPLTDFYGGYAASVGIGDPMEMYYLIVDSASAITWIGADTKYESRTGMNTEVPVGVDYGYGSFEGTLFEDSMTFGTDELSIGRMPFGVASTSEGFVFDGILGIGPRHLTRGTMNPPEAMIPTVTDYLVQQGGILEPVVGIFFQPVDTHESLHGHGEISFGEANRQRYTGSIEYTDLTATPDSSHYWGINQRITYKNAVILEDTAGIVYCGCTFLYIASDAFERYKAATGGTVNAANDLLQISPDQYAALRSLYFHIGENTYEFINNAQIWPRSLNHSLDGGGGDNDIFLIVRGLTSSTGSGLDFIIGYVFLQRFYTVFDSGSRPRVGFAQTLFTDATSN